MRHGTKYHSVSYHSEMNFSELTRNSQILHDSSIRPRKAEARMLINAVFAAKP